MMVDLHFALLNGLTECIDGMLVDCHETKCIVAMMVD